jgi:hypothetical protein
MLTLTCIKPGCEQNYLVIIAAVEVSDFMEQMKK